MFRPFCCCFWLLFSSLLFAQLIGTSLPAVHQKQQNMRRHAKGPFASVPVGPARSVIRRAPFIRQQNEQHKSGAAFMVHPPAIRPPKGVASKLNQAKLKDFFRLIKMKRLQKA